MEPKAIAISMVLIGGLTAMGWSPNACYDCYQKTTSPGSICIQLASALQRGDKEGLMLGNARGAISMRAMRDF
jgi:hypothetical protein